MCSFVFLPDGRHSYVVNSIDAEEALCCKIMIFIPRSIESRGHHERSPAVRNFILTAGLFWFLKRKFTFAAAKLHIFLKQPNIFAMICPSLSLSQLISEKFANFLDGSIGNYSQILLCFSSSSSSSKFQVLNCLACISGPSAPRELFPTPAPPWDRRGKVELDGLSHGCYIYSFHFFTFLFDYYLLTIDDVDTFRVGLVTFLPSKV